MRTAVIAALPRELKGLVEGWRQLKSPRPGVQLFAREDQIAVTAGIGCARASLAVEAALAAKGGVEHLISFGLAGACDPAQAAGQALWCGSVVDVRSGERFTCREDGPVLATSDRIASVAEKRRLRESYGAALVDMEAASVGRLARAHGLGFSALKAVSDSAASAMDGMGGFVTELGGFRELAYGFHLATRPAKWGAVIALGRASTQGLNAATAELVRLLRR